ncbi:MAG TPA: V-type ATP synthase subunit D [Candidatus Subteraquimicrobiales bacterium]
MEEVRTTRTEYLKKKDQIQLAEQGRDLLKQKRDALLIEFMSLIDETLSLSEKLERAVLEAQYAIVVANAVDGAVTVKSVSMATKGEVMIEMSRTKIMGVPVPEISKEKSPLRSLLERGYSITGVSSRIDEAAEKFEKAIDLIVEAAVAEVRLRRLGEEIQKTNRRVNALEQVLVPNLREQLIYIRMALEERAREDLFRLKKVKASIERKKAAFL